MNTLPSALSAIEPNNNNLTTDAHRCFGVEEEEDPVQRR